ncbi:dehydrogenase/reductase SDR family member 11-like [Amphiura filiformis]|uniref:dehydrogenase/reductase SDR family member 11-like n=1 Tax=Amphiura filiformis TaxID=82378 RepID=UPI003B21FBFD
MAASRWSGRVALVTGSSAGIGFAVTKQLAQLGMEVIGCARNIDKIKQLEEECKVSDIPGSVHALKCDVSKEDEILTMFAEIKEKYGGVDVCINNAGMGRDASLLEGNTEKWRQMLDLNVMGLCVCTKEAVKSMRERNVDDGHIFHMNSFSGHRIARGFPASNFYVATKFAVTALTEGLRQELREIHSHIRITSISPAKVDTEIGSRVSDKERADEIHRKFKPLEVNDISDAIVYALHAPTHVQVHDILLRGTEQPH